MTRSRRTPSTWARSGLLAVALAAAACGEPLQPGDLDGAELSEAGGCGQVLTYAATPDGTHLLRADWDVATDGPTQLGALEDRVALPHDDVRVRLEVGERLAERVCTDIVDPEWPDIEQEWQAVAGEAHLVIEEAPDDDFPVATVTLTDVELEPDDGEASERWRLDRVEIPEVTVGWYAG